MNGIDSVGELHDLRKEIDGIIKKVDAMRDLRDAVKLEAVYPPREMALAYTKLQEAKMWVGQALKELGHPLPPEFADEAE